MSCKNACGEKCCKITGLDCCSTVIGEFSGKYDFLSNFYLCKIAYEGITYQSAENAYQAQKCVNDMVKISFIDKTPGQAKRLGRKVAIIPDWEEIKEDQMYQIVKRKFTQNPELGFKLLQTGSAKLVEGNVWGDIYWGVCKGVGQNKLGEILMKVRDELKNENKMEVIND